MGRRTPYFDADPGGFIEGEGMVEGGGLLSSTALRGRQSFFCGRKRRRRRPFRGPILIEIDSEGKCFEIGDELARLFVGEGGEFEFCGGNAKGFGAAACCLI